MNAIVRNAIARLEVRDGGAITSRGTAFLVGHNLILTALHVVADREEALRVGPGAATQLPPLRAGELWLTFPNRLPVTASVKPGKWDARADWVMLECDGQPPADVRPLSLATVGRDGDMWETHGFPDAKPDGITVGGSIRDRHGRVRGESAYQLQCDEASAGDGMPVSGLSGAPVVVDGRVVGALRWALLTEKMDLTKRARTTSVGGTLYACPADQFATACGYADPLPSVSRSPRRPSFLRVVGWVAAALLLTVTAIALSRRLASGPPSTTAAALNDGPAPAPAVTPGPAAPRTAATPGTSGPSQSCPPGASMVGTKLDLPAGADSFEKAPLLSPCVYLGLEDADERAWRFFKVRLEPGQSLTVTARLRDSDLPGRVILTAPQLETRLHDVEGGVQSSIQLYGASDAKAATHKTADSGFAFVSLRGAVRDSTFLFSVSPGAAQNRVQAPAPAVTPGPTTPRPMAPAVGSAPSQSCPPGASMVGAKLDLPAGGDSFEKAPLLSPCVYRGLEDADERAWSFFKVRLEPGQGLTVTVRLRDSDLPQGIYIGRGHLEARLHDVEGGVRSGVELVRASESKSATHKTADPGFAFVSLRGAVRDSAFQLSVVEWRKAQ